LLSDLPHVSPLRILNKLQSDLLNGVDAVKGAAKKALAAQEQSLEHSAQTASALQGLKQVCEYAYFVPAIRMHHHTFTLPEISSTGCGVSTHSFHKLIPLLACLSA
jgi:hypothetical protein